MVLLGTEGSVQGDMAGPQMFPLEDSGPALHGPCRGIQGDFITFGAYDLTSIVGSVWGTLILSQEGWVS